MDWEIYFKHNGIVKDSCITWCQRVYEWQADIVTAQYGNEPTVGICYQAADILVTIPQWSERHQQYPVMEIADSTLTAEPKIHPSS